MARHVAIDQMIEKSPVKGARGRIVHGEALTMAHWRFEAGTVLPRHDHPHEQMAMVIDGTMELTVGEQVYTLTAGEALTIPGGIPHEARAVTDCTIIDAFSPRRDDLV